MATYQADAHPSKVQHKEPSRPQSNGTGVKSSPVEGGWKTAPPDSRNLTPSGVLQLQRSVGNQAVARLLGRDARPSPPRARQLHMPSSGQPVQRQLKVGPVNDHYEQEADRVAKQVVSLTATKSNHPVQRHQDEDEVQLKSLSKSITPVVRRHPYHASEEQLLQGKWLLQRHPGHSEEDKVVQGKRIVQRHPSHAEEEEVLQGKRLVQRHPSHAEEEEVMQGKRSPAAKTLQKAPGATKGIGSEGGALDQATESAIRDTQGGQPLDNKVRGSMEQAFGADFGGVRVHTSAKADTLNRSLQARAFTTGQNIFFRQGEYNPNNQGGKQLLAHELTHVVQQNSSVVQPKRRAEKPNQEAAQRKAVTKDGGGLIRRNFFKKLFGIGKKKREAKLSAKHGVPIGSSGPNAGNKAHFSHGMMDKIDKVLSNLPESHVGGNDKLKTIGSLTPAEIAEAQANGQEPGAASTYDGSTGKISMNKPKSWMPWWLYTMLAPKWKWQRKMMDDGAMGDYKGISKEKDEELGINNSERSVFAGVSDAMVKKGGLATGTLRHEMGHAVDDKIKFTRTRGYLPLFGGWRSYSSEDRIGKIAKKALASAGVDDKIINLQFKSFAVLKDFVPELTQEQPKLNWDPAQKAKDYAGIYAMANPGTDETEKMRMQQELTPQLAKYKQFVTFAHVQPWTISDGGKEHLELDNGRLYQKDHYGTWVSYLAEKRKHAVSNYQFSNPGEWFAEAYAAYYDPARNSKARDLLEPGVISWFEKNLGHREKAHRVQAKLVDDQGKLNELRPFDMKHGLADPTNDRDEEQVLPQKDGELMQALMEMNDFAEFDMDIEK